MKVFFYMATPGGLTGAPRRLLTLTSVLTEWQIDVCIASESGSELLKCAETQHTETVVVETAGVLSRRQGGLFAKGFLFRIRLLFALLRQNLRIYRYIRRTRSDVVWLRSSKGIGFGAVGALLSRRPLIWDVDYELPSRGVVRKLHLLGLKASRAVIFQYHSAPNDIFGEVLAARYHDKFRVIVPGIDLTQLEDFRTRRKHRQSNECSTFVILQVGTICDRKNQWLLIQAVSDLMARYPALGLEIWIAGGVFDEAYFVDLCKHVEQQGLQEIITFLGWRTDVHALMAEADVLAMPSKDEGVPNTVQEAMAIGLPVLVSDVGGMPEIVVDGETGWVLGRDNPAAWGKRLYWCSSHQKECYEVGERGHDYASKNFGSCSWAREYSRVLMELT